MLHLVAGMLAAFVLYNMRLREAVHDGLLTVRLRRDVCTFEVH